MDDSASATNRKGDSAAPSAPSPDQYQFAILCALEHELQAVLCCRDEIFNRKSIQREAKGDTNSYHLVRMGEHYVVVVMLPETGTASASGSVAHLGRTFPKFKLVLMVGIGGGVPHDKAEGPIRLGDVVFGHSRTQHGSILKYESGKEHQGRKFESTGHTNSAPHFALSAVKSLKALIGLEKDTYVSDRINDTIGKLHEQIRSQWQRPALDTDKLYQSSYRHQDPKEPCTKCCEPSRLAREPRQEDDGAVRVYSGLVASGEKVIKSATKRDKFAKKGVSCIETEAAGAANDFACLVIRGISDYCDTHKNDQWHKYAALAAAVVARLFLDKLNPSLVNGQENLQQALARLDTIAQDTKTEPGRMSRKTDKMEVLTWLSKFTSEMETIQVGHLSQHTTGTLEWFLEKPEFQIWQSSKGGALYCKGIPGSGKTILTSFVINHLKSSSANDAIQPGLAYFYCSLGVDRKPLPIYVFLASLLKQLISQQEEIPDCIALSGWSNTQGLEVSATESDVRAYLSQEFSSPELLLLRDATFREKCIECIVDRSKRMFLLAKLRAKYLINLNSRAEITGFLTPMKDDKDSEELLTEAYKMTIERVKSAMRPHLAGKLFQWIIFAQRPMTLAEIIHALSVEAGDDSLLPDQMTDEDTILSKTGGLIEVNNITQSDLQTRERAHHFYVYASKYWGIHAHRWLEERERRGSREIDGETSVALRKFLAEPQSVRSSNQAYAMSHSTNSSRHSKRKYRPKQLPRQRGTTDRDDPGEICGVHLAAIYGLTDIVMLMAQEDIRVLDSRDERGNTVLLHASRRGHDYLVERILQQMGEDPIKQKNDRGETPLIAAVINRHLSVVRLLLRNMRPEDVRAKDKKSKTALTWAAYLGQAEFVEELIQKDQAVIYDKDSDSLTPLARAAEKGHKASVEILCDALLRSGDTRKKLNEAFNSAFFKGCEGGQTDIVKMLWGRVHDYLDINWSNREGRSHLWPATRNKHLDIVRFLVTEAGADATLRDNRNVSPMLLAWRANDLELMLLFLSRSTLVSEHWALLYSFVCREANIDLASRILEDETVNVDFNSVANGATPLTWAAECNNGRLARKIISHPNMDVNLTDSQGRCPLLIASENSNKSIVETLLAHKDIDANRKSREGLTPLLAAMRKGAKATVSILLRSEKVDQTMADNDGSTPLHFAIDNGIQEAVRVLIQSQKVDWMSKDGKGLSLLARALKGGRKDITGILVQACSALLSIDDANGRIPLLVAIDKGRKNMVDQVISLLGPGREETLRLRDNRGRAALHAAVESGRMGIVGLVGDLCRKEEFAMQDNNGCTAVHLAIHRKRADLVGYLINLPEAVVSFTKKDKDGLTPLCLAVVRKDVNTVQVLVDYMQKNNLVIAANTRDSKGRSPLAIAISQDFGSIIAILTTATITNTSNPSAKTFLANANGKNKLGHGCLSLAVQQQRRLGIKKSLISMGAKLDAQDKRGKTPLIHAVEKASRSRNLEPVQQMLRLKSINGQGLNPNLTDKAGNTALVLAAKIGDDELVELLSSVQNLPPSSNPSPRLQTLFGVDVNARDKDGMTALMHAAGHGMMKTVEVLLEKPVDVNLANNEGKTALKLAKEGKHWKVVNKLRQKKVGSAFQNEHEAPAKASRPL
ncbi:Ankyrin-2 [Paramyrothecium foliicola]|nr:Ankyrin-2 [Paramyrothecium foliicola]